MNAFLLVLLTIVLVATFAVLVYPSVLWTIGKLIQASQREYRKRGRE